MKGKQFNKIKIDYGNCNYYRFYKSRYINTNPKLYNVSSKLYLQILSEFNEMLVQVMLDENIDYKLPYNLGTIGIRKYKPKFKTENGKIIANKLPIDPIETRKLWESNPDAKARKIYVRFNNKHSEGFVFKLYWAKSKALFKNKTIYTMSFKRSFKRMLAQRIKEKSIDAYIL